MKMNKWMMSLVLVTSSAFAQGGSSHGGGGGNVLECIESGKIKYYLLDVWEAKNEGQNIEMGGPTLRTMQEKIEYVRARYAKIDPVRAQAYADEANKMAEDIQALKLNQATPNGLVLFQGPLENTADANPDNSFKSLYHDEKPTHTQCAIGQLVLQKPKISPLDPFYKIDRHYWEFLSLDQQVATLYHEAIYKEFRSVGVYNSKAARNLNGLVMSGKILNITSSQYVEMIRSQGLKSFLLGGLFNAFGAVTLDSRGEIVGLENQSFQFGNLKFILDQIQFNDEHEFVSAVFGVSSLLKLNTTKLRNVRYPAIVNNGSSSAPNFEAKTEAYGGSSSSGWNSVDDVVREHPNYAIVNVFGGYLKSISKDTISIEGLQINMGESAVYNLTVDQSGNILTEEKRSK